MSMSDDMRADRCAEIMDNISDILSLDGQKASVRWYGYDMDTGRMHINSEPISDASKYVIEHRCVTCGEDRMYSTRAFLFKLKQADIRCFACPRLPSSPETIPSKRRKSHSV